MIQQLLPGFVTTVKLTAFAGGLAVVAASIAALGRVSTSRSLRLLSLAYVEAMRGVPVLVLLIVSYFALGPTLGRAGISTFWLAVAVLGLNEGGYLCEIYRAAIRSVESGQWEAAAAIGLSRGQCMRRVILPGAIAPALPPTVNGLIYTLKDSALASLITVNDLTGVANAAISETFQALKYFGVSLAIYVALAIVLAYVGKLAEVAVARWLGARPLKIPPAGRLDMAMANVGGE